MSESLQAHQYGGLEDLHLMRDLVVAARASRGPRSSHWHVGDVVWGLFQNTVFDAAPNVRLWTYPEGTIRGFAWFDPPDEFAIDLHPSERSGGELTDDMFAWAEARGRELDADKLSISALDGDPERIALLERLGFGRTERHNVMFRRSLDDLRAGELLDLEIRPVAGEHEFEERVAIHRDVWHPSRVTLEAYRRLRAAPGYDPALDLVAVLGGRFASYCICWLDDANGIGEFEPVGTREEFRRRGIGRTLIVSALHRLRQRGMHTAIVLTASFNDAALRLYESAGFAVVDRQHVYQKRLARV